MENRVIRVLLVVSDEDTFLKLQEMFFQIEGGWYQLEWASSYEEAIKKKSRESFQAYVVDYRLGKYCGLDFMRAVKDEAASVILLVSQKDFLHDEAEEIRNANAADYLIKEEMDAVTMERTLRYVIECMRTQQLLQESQVKNRKLKDQIAKAKTQTAIKKAGKKPKDNKGKPRLLVMEDLPQVRELLTQALEKSFAVDEADSIQTAMTLASARTPDIMMLELAFDGRTGVESLRELQCLPGLREVPVVVSSGRPWSQVTDLCKEMRAIGFVPKPFSINDLADQLISLYVAWKLLADPERAKRPIENLQPIPGD